MDDYVGWYTHGNGVGIERQEFYVYYTMYKTQVPTAQEVADRFSTQPRRCCSGCGDGWLPFDSQCYVDGWGNGNGYGTGLGALNGNGRSGESQYVKGGTGKSEDPSGYREDL